MQNSRLLFELIDNKGSHENGCYGKSLPYVEWNS